MLLSKSSGVENAERWYRLELMIVNGKYSDNTWSWTAKEELDELLLNLKLKYDDLIPSDEKNQAI